MEDEDDDDNSRLHKDDRVEQLDGQRSKGRQSMVWSGRKTFARGAARGVVWWRISSNRVTDGKIRIEDNAVTEKLLDPVSGELMFISISSANGGPGRRLCHRHGRPQRPKLPVRGGARGRRHENRSRGR